MGYGSALTKMGSRPALPLHGGDPSPAVRRRDARGVPGRIGADYPRPRAGRGDRRRGTMAVKTTPRLVSSTVLINRNRGGRRTYRLSARSDSGPAANWRVRAAPL